MSKSGIDHGFYLFVVLVAVLVFTLPSFPSAASDGCGRMVYSFEEDFVVPRELIPPDGNRIISDGDLLSITGTVCARNSELVSNFDVREDLGLDAVDVLNSKSDIFAFSTELDSPHNNFTAGDLLFTNGSAIPNEVLTSQFEGIRHDLGLDAVHFVGKQENIVEFVKIIAGMSREDMMERPTLLANLLEKFGLDIWFSVEGTAPVPKKPKFLDGDLLSARDGVIVARNGELLPSSVPAGILMRGVDFGLDSFAANTREPEPEEQTGKFSTEILFKERPKFDDGDVLLFGNGIDIPHGDLVKPFQPQAKFLGLDALSFVFGEGPPKDPNIQDMCGRPVGLFDGGIVSPGGSGTGLFYEDYPEPPRRPCGAIVPIEGFLPETGVKRFRVAYREAGAPIPAIGDAPGIRSKWKYEEWTGTECKYIGSTLEADGDGWIDAQKYLQVKYQGCTNGHIRLAAWDTANQVGMAGGIDRDGHYVIWLEWEDKDGNLHREPYEHHIQLDNTRPRIADLDGDGVGDLKLEIPTGEGVPSVMGACGKAKEIDELKVKSAFEDKYYLGFRLDLYGGNPPAHESYGPHNYYDPNDGTPGVKNTDGGGTLDFTSLNYLRKINMNDLGKSFVECCYSLHLRVKDAAIRHHFTHWAHPTLVAKLVDVTGMDTGWDARTFITFEARPKSP